MCGLGAKTVSRKGAKIWHKDAKMLLEFGSFDRDFAALREIFAPLREIFLEK
jgi:hypothetical protein